jgi:hypothetical protein
MILQELEEYQKKAIDGTMELYKSAGFSALLFLPGKGKTLTMLAIMEKAFSELGIQVAIGIVPKSIIPTWKREIERNTDFLGDENTPGMLNIVELGASGVYAFDPKKIQSSTLLLIRTEAFQTKGKALNLLLNEIQILKKCMAFLDESSMIKNPKSNRSVFIRSSTRLIKYKTIMTGSPITKNISDIWAQFDFLHQRFFGFSASGFDFRYNVKRSIRINEEGAIRMVNQSMADVRLLRRKAALSVVGSQTWRRLSEEAVILEQELSEKQELIKNEVYEKVKPFCFFSPEESERPAEEEMFIELGKEEKAAYKSMMKDLFAISEAGGVVSISTRTGIFQKSRQITGGFIDRDNPVCKVPSKLQTVMDILEDVEEQAIITSSYIAPCKRIYAEFPNGRASLVHGEQSDKDNAESLRRFMAGEVQFLVASTSYISKGIDGLQVAQLMIFYDVPTHDFDQVKRRIFRKGQKGNPRFLILTATKTVDERCYEMLKSGEDMATAIFNYSNEEFLNVF